MYFIAFLLLILQPMKVRLASNIRCYEDVNRSVQLHENCRACVLFIDSINTSSISKTQLAKKLPDQLQELSIEALISSSDSRNHRHRRQVTSILHQNCARYSSGPLYGYNQTHCICDTDQCNYNIQRCIYEVIAKSFFSCYHGVVSGDPVSLEVRSKCRTCRVSRLDESMYNYECLTFAEAQPNNRTQCSCQQPMCNRNLPICERMQPETVITAQMSNSIFNATDSVNSNITVQSLSITSNETWLTAESTFVNVTTSTTDQTVLNLNQHRSCVNLAHFLNQTFSLLLISILSNIFCVIST